MYNVRKAKFLIQQELTLFPQATVVDIYKLFFQSCRGSEHFCEDLNTIKDGIIEEVTDIDLDNFVYPDYDISYLFNIKRVGLTTILIGKYDLNYVADKFLELTLVQNKFSTEEWIKEWKQILKLTLELYPDIVNDLKDQDIDFSKSLHHSDAYRKEYRPHYRICNL
jgi:hypothetical protein